MEASRINRHPSLLLALLLFAFLAAGLLNCGAGSGGWGSDDPSRRGAGRLYNLRHRDGDHRRHFRHAHDDAGVQRPVSSSRQAHSGSAFR